MTPSDRYSPEQQRMINEAKRHMRRQAIATEPPERRGLAFLAQVVGYTFVLLAILVGIAVFGPVYAEALR